MCLVAFFAFALVCGTISTENVSEGVTFALQIVDPRTKLPLVYSVSDLEGVLQPSSPEIHASAKQAM
jgi:hypothetical protein